MPMRTLRNNAPFAARSALRLAVCLAMTAPAHAPLVQAQAQVHPRPVLQPAGLSAQPVAAVQTVRPAQASPSAPSAHAGYDPQQTLRVYLQSETSGLPGRVEVNIGSLDDHVKLAPCAAAEPYIPAGARLWGRSMLGVRCTRGATWSVLVPVHVKVFAPVLVAARPLAPGQSVSEADLRTEELDLTREAPGLLTDASQIGDAILARPLAAGQALRKDQFRPRPVIAQGDQVQVVYAGSGFRISSFGKALSAGIEGQAIRVQVESGRVLTGTARAGRLVEMRL